MTQDTNATESDDQRIVLSVYDGIVTQSLTGRPGNHTANWVFLITENDDLCTLKFKVTHEEVDRIVQRDTYSEGFLEPVRSTLNNPHATITVISQTGSELSSDFEISRTSSEVGFSISLDRAAEAICATLSGS